MGKLIRHEACPACLREGGDTRGNNLAVYDDGAFCHAGHGHKHGHKEYTRKTTGVKEMSEAQPIKDLPRIEYLNPDGKWEEKAISNQALTEFGVGVLEHAPLTLAFPFYEGGQIVGYQYRDLAHERKFGDRKFRVEGKVNLFGLNMLRGSDTLYLVEGLTDTLTIYDTTRKDRNRPDVLGIPGASATKYLTQNYDIIRKYKKIILVPDKDKAGQELIKSVMSLPGMSPYKTHIVYLSDHKDVTEYRLNGDMYYFWEQAKIAKPYAESPFLYNVSQLEDIDESTLDVKHFDTGFEIINHALGGGLHTDEFLGVVGFSGFGKSTFALFMASEIVRLNEDAKVLVIGTEMNYHQNLNALAQMTTRNSWRNGLVTSVQKKGARTQVLENERLFLYRKDADDPNALFEDIELAIVEHGVNVILIDVVTDMFTVNELGKSGAIAQRLHGITKGNEIRNIPSAAVIGVFHTSGSNDKTALSTNKILGGNKVGQQLTAAIVITGTTNSPSVPTDTLRDMKWIKRSREHAPDDIKMEFQIDFNTKTMSYYEVKPNAERNSDEVRGTDLQEQSRGRSSKAKPDVALRARNDSLPQNTRPEETVSVNEHDGVSTVNEVENVETVLETVTDLQAGLPDTRRESDVGVQTMADSSQSENIPKPIPNLQAIIDRTSTHSGEQTGSGRDGRGDIAEDWVNVDTQPIRSFSGDVLNARRVPISNPREYYEAGMLPTPPTIEDRKMYARLARGESDTVSDGKRKRKVKF